VSNIWTGENTKLTSFHQISDFAKNRSNLNQSQTYSTRRQSLGLTQRKPRQKSIFRRLCFHCSRRCPTVQPFTNPRSQSNGIWFVPTRNQSNDVDICQLVVHVNQPIRILFCVPISSVYDRVFCWLCVDYGCFVALLGDLLLRIWEIIRYFLFTSLFAVITWFFTHFFVVFHFFYLSTFWVLTLALCVRVVTVSLWLCTKFHGLRSRSHHIEVLPCFLSHKRLILRSCHHVHLSCILYRMAAQRRATLRQTVRQRAPSGQRFRVVLIVHQDVTGCMNCCFMSSTLPPQTFAQGTASPYECVSTARKFATTHETSTTLLDRSQINNLRPQNYIIWWHAIYETNYERSSHAHCQRMDDNQYILGSMWLVIVDYWGECRGVLWLACQVWTVRVEPEYSPWAHGDSIHSNEQETGKRALWPS